MLQERSANGNSGSEIDEILMFPIATGLAGLGDDGASVGDGGGVTGTGNCCDGGSVSGGGAARSSLFAGTSMMSAFLFVHCFSK